MPSIQINATTIALTDATATALTCTSTAGLVVGMRGWAVKSDDTGNLEVKVSAIFDETTFLCQRLSAANNSGGADLTAYNGGNIYFDTQVVEVSDGADLSSLDAISAGRVPARTTTGFVNATLANIPDSATRVAVTPATRTAAVALAAQRTAGTPINAQTGTTYTLTLDDFDRLVYSGTTCDNPNPVAVTIPKHSVTPIPPGNFAYITWKGDGAVSIAPVDADVTLYPLATRKIAAKGLTVAVRCEAQNVFRIIGATIA